MGVGVAASVGMMSAAARSLAPTFRERLKIADD
jgi:hypothetical protein